MTPSIIYRSATGYELVMRALYGRHYRARLDVIAEQVRPGATVLELCPGPGALYEHRLRGRVGSYTGIDVNPRFVRRLRRLGADARQLDLGGDPNLGGGTELPEADIVIMQASLYHFLPEAAPIIERMLAAARERVIIAEPIRNLTHSRLAFVARLGQRGTDPGTGRGDPQAGHTQRFTEATLDQLMGGYRDRTVNAFTIPGNREKVFVLDPRAPQLADRDPRPQHRSGTGADP
jgi:hypothetical protein